MYVKHLMPSGFNLMYVWHLVSFNYFSFNLYINSYVIILANSISGNLVSKPILFFLRFFSGVHINPSLTFAVSAV